MPTGEQFEPEEIVHCLSSIVPESQFINMRYLSHNLVPDPLV